MLIAKAQKLLELYENGYNINYSSGYVDGTCSIYKEDGGIYLSSSVFSGLEVSGLDEDDFTVTEDVDDWFELWL